MIHKKFVIIILMLTFSIVGAQGELRFGVKAGSNLSTFGGSKEGKSGTDARLSYHIGGLVEIPITDKISLQPELLYSKQGSASALVLWSGNYDHFLDYINVPILGKYYVISGLSGELGPVFGFLVNAERENGPGTIDVKDKFNNFDFAAAIGLSYRFPFGLFCGLRYNLGVVDINDDPNISGKSQNNVFQVSAGYTF